jgi:hypothetical protein
VSAKLKQAFEEGCILAVKWSLVTLLVGGSLFLLFMDYMQVRQGALQGKASFEYIQKAIQEQQKAKPQETK